MTITLLLTEQQHYILKEMLEGALESYRAAQFGCFEDEMSDVMKNASLGEWDTLQEVKNLAENYISLIQQAEILLDRVNSPA